MFAIKVIINYLPDNIISDVDLYMGINYGISTKWIDFDDRPHRRNGPAVISWQSNRRTEVLVYHGVVGTRNDKLTVVINNINGSISNKAWGRVIADQFIFYR